jgi:hypothetical protein
VDSGDAVDVADELLHLLGDLRADRAGGGRQGEGDVDLGAVLDLDVVDEAEGDEVEPELGVDYLLEGLVDVLVGHLERFGHAFRVASGPPGPGPPVIYPGAPCR